MALLLSMIPFYLAGNLHCLGMCGPLVMMLGQHKQKYWYFLGRILSYSLTGAIAGGMGAVLNGFLQKFHLGALQALSFGIFIIWIGFSTYFSHRNLLLKWIGKKTSRLTKALTVYFLKNKALGSFLFGFFTVALPCGQTLIVFSACALSGSFLVGLLNGLVFAILTSPSLWLSLWGNKWFKLLSQRYQVFIVVFSSIIGGVAILRSLAELGIISHKNLINFADYHLTLF
ncbi:hypothetical protein BN1013_01293 [Candidatus Rubidus massiliensis]|nr:hypothetical protein BN1013_01293 [Candidatus Rubidus massiliensis]